MQPHSPATTLFLPPQPRATIQLTFSSCLLLLDYLVSSSTSLSHSLSLFLSLYLLSLSSHAKQVRFHLLSWSVLLVVPLQKAYETKQYKKGVKAADAILKRFPEHGGELSGCLLPGGRRHLRWSRTLAAEGIPLPCSLLVGGELLGLPAACFQLPAACLRLPAAPEGKTFPLVLHSFS